MTTETFPSMPYLDSSGRIDISPIETPVKRGFAMIMQKALRGIEFVLEWPLVMVIKHFEKRKFELAMTMIMLGEVIVLLSYPGSMKASAFRYMLQVMSTHTMIVVFLFFGVSRIIALILNGNWMPWGAYVRAGGALVGAIMWGQMDASLFMLPGRAGTPLSPGVPTYTVLALFELISMYEALIGALHHNGRRSI